MPTSTLLTYLLTHPNADILLGDGTRHAHHTAIIEGSSAPLAALLTSPLTKYEEGRAQISFAELDAESWAVVSYYMEGAASKNYGGAVETDTSTQALTTAYDFANAYLLPGLKSIIVRILTKRLSYKELAEFGILYGEVDCLEAATNKMKAAIRAEEKLEPVDSEHFYTLLVRCSVTQWRELVLVAKHVAEHRPQFLAACVDAIIKAVRPTYAPEIMAAVVHSDVLNEFRDIHHALALSFSRNITETADFPFNKEIRGYMDTISMRNFNTQ